MMPQGARAAGTFIANGRYEIRGWLGEGTYGEVYEVYDHHQNQHVALKFLGPANPAPWIEAQRLTALRSEFILPVLNADSELGVPYIVTEIARHGSAERRMLPFGVRPSQAVRWVQHACLGAARAHQDQILHRDIKPANLFLTAEGEAVLGDFGLACPVGPTGFGPPLGTPVTVAPEATPGGIGTSVRSDVYSLGATLYALLAGRYAHQGPTDAHVYSLVVTDPPPNLRDLAPHVSQALWMRVLCAMAKDPADRYETPARFAAALGALPWPSRNWWRTDEHAAAGHYACWTGQSPGRSDATVCAVPAGKRFEVVAAYQPSGRRIKAACRSAAPLSSLSRNVRTAMAALP